MAEANEVLIPCPISEREAIKIIFPFFWRWINKLGWKPVACSEGIKSLLSAATEQPKIIPPEAKPNNFTKSLLSIF